MLYSCRYLNCLFGYMQCTQYTILNIRILRICIEVFYMQYLPERCKNVCEKNIIYLLKGGFGFYIICKDGKVISKISVITHSIFPTSPQSLSLKIPAISNYGNCGCSFEFWNFSTLIYYIFSLTILNIVPK